MSLTAHALCTLDELKTYLGVGDTHKDSLLEPLIEDASRRIIDYIGYDPHSDTYTDELYSGDGTHELVTKARPITSIVAVKEWDGDTYDDIETDDFNDMQNRTWYIDGVDFTFAKGASNYKVSYVAGWGDTDCDARFRLSCMRIAGWLAKESGKAGVLGIASQSQGEGSRTTYQDVMSDALGDLTVYRRLTP